MNWNQLEYIIVTAEEKSITKAAQRLFISQPSLSISIRQLEEELGKPLFERKNGKMQLTFAGELFHKWAKMVVVSHKRLEGRFAELRGEMCEKVRIGISPHRSTIVTPILMKRICKEYPLSELQIVEKPTNELEILLKDDKLDMIIDIPGSNSMIYHYEEITQEGMCLAVPESFIGHGAFAEGKQDSHYIDLSELGEYWFILLPEQSYFGTVSRKSLEIAGVVPKVICECTLSQTIRNLVEEQIGIALLPDSFVSKALVSPRIRYYRIKDDKFSRKIGIVYKTENYHSSVFMGMVELVKETFREVYVENTI